MTLNEAIAHARSVEADGACKIEHEQLAEWLEELIRLRQKNSLLTARMRHMFEFAEGTLEDVKRY